MRDPKRIPITLGIIQTLWEQYPDLRLMQMIGNLGLIGDEKDVTDLYYLEDEELAELLMDMYHGKQRA